jgi:hypothetical protein
MNIGPAETAAPGPNAAGGGWRRLLAVPPLLLLLWLGFGAVSSMPAADVHVRWAPHVTPEQRESFEHRFLLTDPEHLGGTTWKYVLLDVSRRNIGRLVEHPAAEDTAGIDRQRLASVALSRRNVSMLRAVPLIRHPRVAQHITWALQALSMPPLLWLLWRMRRGVPLSPWCRPLATGMGVVTLTVLGYLTTNQRLGSDDSFSVGIAQSFLRGDRPYLDFFDAGAPLAWWLSALGQWLTGGLVLGEVGVAVVLQAIGLLLAYRLTRLATGSLPLSLVLVTTAATCTYATQLYGYPKAFIYPVALWGIWWFLDSPTLRRTAVLAVIATTAFLLRHDHGLYIGIAAVTAVLSGYFSDGAKLTIRRCAVFGVVIVSTLMPLLAVIHAREGLQPYFRDRVQLAQFLGIGKERPPFTFAALWPLVGAADPWPVTVNVRWRDGLPAAQISHLQDRFQLQALPRGPDRYTLGDTQGENIRALIRNPDVLWVRGVDALTYRPVEATPVFVLRNWLAAHSLVPFPRTLEPAGAINLLYSILMVTPFAALAVLLAARLARPREIRALEIQRVIAASVLLVAVHFGIMRTAGRVLDTMPIDIVLFGWLLARLGWLTSVVPMVGRSLSVGAHAVAGLLAAVVCLTGLDAADAGDLLDRSELKGGPSAASRRAAQLWRLHTAPSPIDVFSPPGTVDDSPPGRADERTIVRYLYECTAPGDRIWEPTSNFAMPYYADRGMVQHQWWSSGFRRERAQQEQTLSWLERQRVPIVIVAGPQSSADVFRSHPLIYAYVRANYVLVTSAVSGVYTDGRSLEVLVRRDRRPVRVYEGLDLPCFTPAR